MIINIQHVSFALELVAFPGKILIAQKVHIPIWVVQEVLKPRKVILFDSKKNRLRFYPIQSGSGLLRIYKNRCYVRKFPFGAA